MRLATYLARGGPATGIVVDEAVHPFAAGVTMRDLIDAGLDTTAELAERALREWPVRLSDVRLLAPLVPASVRDFVAFEEHVEGVRRSIDGVDGVSDAWYDAPAFYFTNPHAILGPGDRIDFPAACTARDFELEVAAIVSGGGSNLSVSDAREHLFGYTIFNDWSARDLQRREMQVGLGPAKGKDFGSTLGPWIVTADELETYRDSDGFLALECSVTVNDVEIGRDVLSNMGWTFESLLSYASRNSAVVSGDVLGSGTTGHGGCLAELWGRNGSQTPPPLQPGDLVTLRVQGIGALTNKVGVAAATPALPAVRRGDAEQRRAATVARSGALVS